MSRFTMRHARCSGRSFALLDEITASTTDDPFIDNDEADEIRDKWEDLKATLEPFVVSCEQGHYHLKKLKK